MSEVCECYELVRQDFLRTAKDLLKVSGEFPATKALDRLYAVSEMDSVLIAKRCIDHAVLMARREETEQLINEATIRARGLPALYRP